MPLGPDFHRLVSAAKTGAEWAWVVIYEELAGPVTAYLAAQGAAEPEDLASEVFLQAARDLAAFEGDEKGFRSWLFVIAHRRLVDSWRAADRRLRPTLDLEAIAEPPGGDVEEEALDRLAGDQLVATLRNLTQGQRAVLCLRIIGNLTLEDTARVLDLRIGAVKALQRRAIIALQEVFKDRA
ncbi:MAG: hypothetical protein A2W26_11480 [Acidobacteria bacterium RBG_16_64_8]|nr:MAG: hypothetical protein A2W26_11480 [Acidobacteria bacterium RBG_16_64_8]